MIHFEAPLSHHLWWGGFINQLLNAIQDHFTTTKGWTEICWKFMPPIGISSISGEFKTNCVHSTLNLRDPCSSTGVIASFRVLYFAPTELKEDHISVFVSLESDEGWVQALFVPSFLTVQCRGSKSSKHRHLNKGPICETFVFVKQLLIYSSISIHRSIYSSSS